ncbi:MAG: fibronectin type III-like domain-contianing protein, partial [Muribaculaceae bacterium]|nr:fibronectin type III-like domain-contianing protein [Muribaculaceae bacterium]
VAWADHASSANFPTEGAASQFGFDKEESTNKLLWDYTPYEEDIYVGYRYFDSFGKDVSYPFGYGLSYTSFEYSEPKISEDNGVYTVTVDVKNTGGVAGKEVVQLYAKAPDAKAANKPEHELKAFAKTRSLKPGEAQTVSLTFAASDLASYDEEKNAWVVDEGDYVFEIGASSRDIKGKVNANVAGMEKSLHDVLKPQTSLNTLKRK